MNTDRDYLAAGLALGGLNDAELTQAQALADTDDDFRSEVAAYEDTMALMAESDATAVDAPEPVSAATRDAILAIPSTQAQEDVASETPHQEQTASSPQPQHQLDVAQLEGDTAPPPPTDLAEHRRKRRPWVAWAAAAAAVVVVAGIGGNAWQVQQEQSELEDKLASTQQQLDNSARLMEAGDLQTTSTDLPEGGSVTVLSSETEQLIRFSPRDVDVAPSGKSLQMWVIGDEGPKSVGLMRDQAVTIADAPFSAGNLFGITVEPKGGSDQPTTDPIAAISL